MAATFDIEIVTRTTEFRVRPGDKVALPCEVRSSGEHNISEDATLVGGSYFAKYYIRPGKYYKKMFLIKACCLVTKEKLE